MIRIYKSSSGQWILTHPPTQSVVIADDAERGYEELRSLVGEQDAGAGDEQDEETSRASSPAALEQPPMHRKQIWGLVAVVALAPFVWLTIASISVGSLVADLRVGDQREQQRQQSSDDAAEVERLRIQLNELAAQQRQPEESSAIQRRKKAARKRRGDRGPKQAPSNERPSKDAAEDPSTDEAELPAPRVE